MTIETIDWVFLFSYLVLSFPAVIIFYGDLAEAAARYIIRKIR